MRVTKDGDLYRADADGWPLQRPLSFPPMPLHELIRALEQEGIHQTDIGDALYAADPDWGGEAPRLNESEREQIRALGAERNVDLRRVVPRGSVRREMFLVTPSQEKDASSWLARSAACEELSKAIHEVLPDRDEEPRVVLAEEHFLKQTTEPV